MRILPGLVPGKQKTNVRSELTDAHGDSMKSVLKLLGIMVLVLLAQQFALAQWAEGQE